MKNFGKKVLLFDFDLRVDISEADNGFSSAPLEYGTTLYCGMCVLICSGENF